MSLFRIMYFHRFFLTIIWPTDIPIEIFDTFHIHSFNNRRRKKNEDIFEIKKNNEINYELCWSSKQDAGSVHGSVNCRLPILRNV